MRNNALVLAIFSVCCSGCSQFIYPGPGPDPFYYRLEFEYDAVVKKADTIHIVTTTYLADGTKATFDCKVRKNAKSWGKWIDDKGHNDWNRPNLDLPAGIHDECLARLQDADFFRIEAVEPLQIPFTKAKRPVSSIEVHFRDQQHTVKKFDGIDIDEGYEKLWTFVHDLQKRGTVSSQAVNRNLDRMGGVISGLTPAGTPVSEVPLSIRSNRD